MHLIIWISQAEPANENKGKFVLIHSTACRGDSAECSIQNSVSETVMLFTYFLNFTAVATLSNEVILIVNVEFTLVWKNSP